MSAATRAELQMHSWLVAPLLARVRATGADVAELLARFDLPESAERAEVSVLPLATLEALFDEAARVTGDASIGLHLGEELGRGTFGVVEFVCEKSPDVRSAIERLTRYHALLNDLVVLTATSDRAGRLVVDHRIPGKPFGAGRHANEFFVAHLLTRTRTITARDVVPVSASLAHPEPRDSAELRRVLRTRDVRFSAESNGFVLSPEDARAELTTADAGLSRVLDAHAALLLAARPTPARFLGQVRAEVRARLRPTPPSLEVVARALRMAPRTLQRRLADEGTTLKDVVEAIRRELGTAFAREGKLRVDALAFELGYADTRAFLRAFKRWTGTTPKAYRGR
jgi:AraC-like DNA-binding protein